MQPLAGRRLWLVGIGGAGMSALAIVARAWGAEVAGSDRARTPYVELLERDGDRRHRRARRRENVPPGSEVVVSSAIAADNPELARRGDTPLDAGRAARRARRAPALDRRRRRARQDDDGVDDRLLPRPARARPDIPDRRRGASARGERRARGRGGSSPRATSPTARCSCSRPRIAVVTNVELDHHATFASRAEVEELFADWLASLPAGAVVIRGEQVEAPADARARRPGRAQPRERGVRARRARRGGCRRRGRRARARRVPGRGRRFELRGEAGGVRVVDDYGHHPTEVAATLAAARVRRPERSGDRPLPAASVLAHAASRARVRRGARRRGRGRA